MRNRQVVVITGASAGVGRATAHAFAKRGARIGLVARSRVALEKCRHEVEAAGGEAIVLPTDVSDFAQVEKAARQVEARWGRIDVWVNDAMVSVFAPVRQTTPEEYRRVTEVTYLGYVHGTLAALPGMSARDRGVIIQVGSALAYRSIPLQSAYCAAKHAIAGFSESLRTELLHERSGVRIVMVELPAVNTPQFDWVRSRLPREAQPVPPIFQPSLIAEAIVWAADHPRKDIYLGWPTWKAILGEKFASRFADRYLAKRGYDSQQTDRPAHARPDNLYAPVEGLHRTEGRFSARAKRFSLAIWLRLHRPLWMSLSAGTIALLAYASSRSRGRETAVRERDLDAA
jgi:NADP-dependent 3-hydroxy acid dehydrogenase YdfG